MSWLRWPSTRDVYSFSDDHIVWIAKHGEAYMPPAVWLDFVDALAGVAPSMAEPLIFELMHHSAASARHCALQAISRRPEGQIRARLEWMAENESNEWVRCDARNFLSEEDWE